MQRYYWLVSLLVLFIGSAEVVSANSTQPLSNSNTGQFIDLHAHVAGFGINSNCYINPKLKKSFRFKGLQRLFGIKEKVVKKNGGDSYVFDLIDQLLSQSTKVKKIVLMAFDQVYDSSGKAIPSKSPFYVPNKFVEKGTARFQSLLYAASVHPFRKDAIQELQRVEKMGAMYVKLIPSIHQFQPDDPKIDNYWKELARLKLPVLIHLDDEGTFGGQANQFTGAYKIERALKLGVTVIAAHVATRGHTHVDQAFCARTKACKTNPAGPILDNYQQLRVLAMNYANLYADISALPNRPHRKFQLIEVLNDPIWKDKLLYGSDYPLNNPILQSKNSLKKAWDLFRQNGVDPEEFNTPSKMEKRWDRDIRLKQAFGVPADAFARSEKFLKMHGRL